MARPKMTEGQMDEQIVDINNDSNDNTREACLRNEKVVIRFVPRRGGMKIDNPKHILYGGMSEGSKQRFVCPINENGSFVAVLTSDEQSYIEEVMGLESNALNVHRKKDNFWDDSQDNFLAYVDLGKDDVTLDLSDPMDYIKYKILLAYDDIIAPNREALSLVPRDTYQFVITNDDADVAAETSKMNKTMECYKLLGKYEDSFDKLKYIVESIESKPLSKGVKIEWLRARCNELIQHNSSNFLNVAKDPMLNTKVFIKMCVASGIIYHRDSMLYVSDGDIPLCGKNEIPTLNNASKYLNDPANKDLLLNLQAKLNNK